MPSQGYSSTIPEGSRESYRPCCARCSGAGETPLSRPERASGLVSSLPASHLSFTCHILATALGSYLWSFPASQTPPGLCLVPALSADTKGHPPCSLVLSQTRYGRLPTGARGLSGAGGVCGYWAGPSGGRRCSGPWSWLGSVRPVHCLSLPGKR